MSSEAIRAGVGEDRAGHPFAMVFIPGRPALINGERSAHFRKHREATKITRRYGFFAGQRLANARYTFPDPALIVSQPTYATRRSWPDVGNWAPHTKAIIDGLVDAGAWPDDTHRHISQLHYLSPIKHDLGDGLLLTIADGPPPETPLPDLQTIITGAA